MTTRTMDCYDRKKTMRKWQQQQVYTLKTLMTIIRHEEDDDFDECLTIRCESIERPSYWQGTLDTYTTQKSYWWRDNSENLSGRHWDDQNFGVTRTRWPHFDSTQRDLTWPTRTKYGEEELPVTMDRDADEETIPTVRRRSKKRQQDFLDLQRKRR
jgi:hypothetical protein